MSKLSNTVDKKKSLTEFIIVIVIIGILMKLFIDLFFEQRAKVTNSLLIGIIQQFTTKVNLVHSAWLTSGQANNVKINQLSGHTSQWVPVNAKGWVDVSDSNLRCQRIWQHVLMMPMLVTNTKVVALEINVEPTSDNNSCRYQLTTGEFFNYYPKSGKVKYQ
jgi:type II secretory pathway pseudopilin PulG